MLAYEEDLWGQGISVIAGLDEVGRGCLFGDVVAAAVILPEGLRINGINDSKKLNVSQRERYFRIIQEESTAVGVGRVDARLIEQINIKQASRLAMKLALNQLSIIPEFLLIDAEKVDSSIPQLAIIHGDAISQSIAAASIIAKVTRDRLCLEWDLEYPQYGLALHKGYATKHHREMIMKYGACPLHRRTFLSNIEYEQQQLF